ncbi:MAG: tRNA threonylcarbamoyladenosine dehydratase [Bacteroidetes bacterium]|uniref:tRNA threonylcarbamoyladenosine dehydratase n=1 Tax=Candidatus Merdivivens pullicola TaxID=2840872 RepID=A0A9D9II96_9BACT|nr:tRNA threonylcarbamoyladenosine dehydratase [Candidatus Merdivivens pullicola]
MVDGWLQRTGMLVGEEALSRLSSSTVIVVGVGGVGGYAAEMLVRAGVGHLVLVDADKVAETDLNRQITALHSTLGRSKCSVLEERFRDINPGVKIDVVEDYLEDGAAEGLLSGFKADFLVDAIDTLAPKLSLIKYCVDKKIPFVSSMGSGAKFDATAVRISDISKSHNCPLAYVIRKKLRKMGISKGFKVVYSEELPDRSAVVECEGRNKKSMVGTVSYIPAVFGCACAQAAIEYFRKID